MCIDTIAIKHRIAIKFVVPKTMPTTKKTAKAAKTKQQKKQPTDSEEEWDAKPTRKIARKKKVKKWYSRYTYEELGPYFAKYDAICDNYKDYCKVQLLVEWERTRDLNQMKKKREKEGAYAESVRAIRAKEEMMIPDIMSSLSSSSSADTISSGL